MVEPTDLTGRRFGRLVAAAKADPDDFGNDRWLAWCRCGELVRAYERLLLDGVATSCGCHPIDQFLDRILQDS